MTPAPSTSIPSTCAMSQEATKANKATKTVSASNFKPKNSEQKHQISNVIGMLWMPHNSERLLALVQEGLGSLRDGYFSGGQSLYVMYR